MLFLNTQDIFDYAYKSLYKTSERIDRLCKIDEIRLIHYLIK